MSKFARIALAGLMAAGILGGATHALAAPRDVITQGQCSGASTWKLTLSIDNGNVQAEFEVDQNVIGDTWRVKMSDNGLVFFKGKAVTQGPDGSFDLRKFTPDQSGTDNIKAMAKNVSTGETCQGSGSI